MPRTYIPGTSHVPFIKAETAKQLTSPPYNPELERLIKDKNRMNTLYEFISWAKWNGSNEDKAMIPKWNEELIILKETFYPNEPNLKT